jgi:hypothetical protein
MYVYDLTSGTLTDVTPDDDPLVLQNPGDLMKALSLGDHHHFCIFGQAGGSPKMKIDGSQQHRHHSSQGDKKV